jgi:hypothetical protein
MFSSLYINKHVLEEHLETSVHAFVIEYNVAFMDHTAEYRRSVAGTNIPKSNNYTHWEQQQNSCHEKDTLVEGDNHSSLNRQNNDFFTYALLLCYQLSTKCVLIFRDNFNYGKKFLTSRFVRNFI